MESIPLALTYDDVLLVPRFSSIKSRGDVNCGSAFTRQIELKTPFVSANMDTVTESAMAIVIAELGGIGVIHRFLTIDAQVHEVLKVKRHQRGVVEKPYTISPDASVAEARRLLLQAEVHGLPVVRDDRKLVGMLTRRDVELAEGDQKVSDRMTPWEHLIVAPPDISLDDARQALLERQVKKLPLVDSQGVLVGLITAADLFRERSIMEATQDENGRLRVAAAVGVVGDYLERAKDLVDAGIDALVVDIAHGDSALMLSAVQVLREDLGEVQLVAGNVATAAGTERLIKAGVDAVKVGVGPGSMCITREVAGVGVPQFTAVLETAEVGRKYEVPIIADGGIRSSADVVKAVGAGASTVMLGNLLAGTDESPGPVITRNGRKMKISRGMASTEASIDRAFRDDPRSGWMMWEADEPELAPEGIQAPVPYRGRAAEVLGQLLAGLRSGMSYSDAATIEKMWTNARFIRQTEAGQREAGAHDVGNF